MTNKEIKFELGKIALTRCDGDLTESLRNIYEWIIEEPEEVIPEQPVNDYEQKPIREVYNEIQCIEEAEKAEKMTGNNWFQKHGHARRFLNVANYYNIETVGQLLEIGKADFMRFKNMGRKCADYVSMALKNLYGIEKW